VTLLVVSPDYASHVIPLATLAGAWRDLGERVVVATGPATAPIVAGCGFEHVDLRLGRGSNPGIIRPEDQPIGEDANLRAFFEASRGGMVETLRYQAAARRTDLLWKPVETAAAVRRIVDDLDPDQIIVDHLAFSATLALRSIGRPYGDVVLGHPTALPVADEVYGYPATWPTCLSPDPGELRALRAQCEAVSAEFTATFNQALAALAPGASPVDDAFAAHGDLVLYNYPAELRDESRGPLPAHAFLGASVRDESPDDDLRRWLESADQRPIVHVSFGSFLSARADVLARVVAALRPMHLRVSLATGSADPAVLGPIPDHWMVRPYLEQVAILDRAVVAVTHGGNNSVTEALAAGVPMVVLPFSTDQFAGAAAIERAGVGTALDPNVSTPATIAAAVESVAEGEPRARARSLGARLQREPGPSVALGAMQCPTTPSTVR
jgi:zeaxanthin glucosyltransferase